MTKVEVWHNPRCSKSRATVELLEDKGVESKIFKYLDEELSVERIRELLDMLDMEPRELMRTKEPIYKELDLKDEHDPQKLIEAMVEHHQLIERPIVIKDQKAVIGRPIESVVNLINGD